MHVGSTCASTRQSPKARNISRLLSIGPPTSPKINQASLHHARVCACACASTTRRTFLLKDLHAVIAPLDHIPGAIGARAHSDHGVSAQGWQPGTHMHDPEIGSARDSGHTCHEIKARRARLRGGAGVRTDIQPCCRTLRHCRLKCQPGCGIRRSCSLLARCQWSRCICRAWCRPGRGGC